jgi:ribosomal protein L11 methyltransferase
MSRQPEYIDLWLTVEAARADWAGQLLCEIGSAGVVETPAEGDLVRVLGSVPAVQGAEARARLEAQLAAAVDCGELQAAPAVGSAATAQVDWQAVLRHHHQPFTIGPVLVRPPWTEPTGAPEVVLEPGMGFGTGNHETTRLCLEALAARLGSHPFRRLLDVGTGSGILALFALRLSSTLDAVACDIDPDALDSARKAARDNGLEQRLQLHLGRAEPEWGPFDLVVANLQWNVFTGEMQRLAASLAAGGLLLCSGILLEQEEGLLLLATEHGLHPAGRSELGEWCLVQFHK